MTPDNEDLTPEQVEALQRALIGHPAVGERSVSELEACAHAMRAAVEREARVAARAERVGGWTKTRWTGAVLGVVVMLVLAAVGVTMRPRRTGHLYATTAGQRLSVTLADGTRATLGPASRMQVADDYASGVRSLTLEGEGYFVVRHDQRHPFTVQTHGVVTRDVGTAFEVRAYPNDPAVLVAVTEGEVAIGAAFVPGAVGAEAQMLGAGDVATITDAEMTIAHHADVASLTGWVQGRLIFDNALMGDVVRQLARTFDLRITIADSALTAQRITGSFEGESVDEILDDIAGLAGGRYERVGKAVVFRKRLPKVSQPTTERRPPLVTAEEHEPQE